MRLAFQFMDYDDDGSIGSVDILNLRKSFDLSLVESINVKFNEQLINKNLGKQLQKRLAEINMKQQSKKKFAGAILASVFTAKLNKRGVSLKMKGLKKTPDNEDEHHSGSEGHCTDSHPDSSSDSEEEDHTNIMNRASPRTQ